MWSNILRRIARLRLLDKNLVVFGAEHHGFTFNPPASVSELVRVEESLEITFPSELRTVYLEIGNGGAGPDYGLLQLSSLQGIRPSVDWPGVEVVNSSDCTLQSISGLLAIMDRYYNYKSCVITSGSESGQIVAFEEDQFAYIEGKSLEDVYTSWLDKEANLLDSYIAAMQCSNDVEAIARTQSTSRQVHPENTLIICASLLGLGAFGLREAQASLSWRGSADEANFSIDPGTKALFSRSINKSVKHLRCET